MTRSHPRPAPAPGPGSLAQGATPLDALATWHAEITRAREHRAGRTLWLWSGSTTSFNPSPEPRANRVISASTATQASGQLVLLA
ncbi:hypothetical protein K1Y80_25165 [Streptomyces sp. MAG02]|nr:hypothetical protein [Streptomyces sp. MAG02]